MSSRFEADGPEMTFAAMALVAVLAIASFSLSFLGLIQAAAWAGVGENLRWLVPIVIDSTILVYAVSATVQRARGENTAMSWLAVGFFTAVSVASNTSHVLAPTGAAQPLSPALVLGSLVAGIMPVSLFFATHTAVNLIVQPVYGTVDQRRRRAAKRLVQNQKVAHRTGPHGPQNGPRVDQQDGPFGPLSGPGMEQGSGPRGPRQVDRSGPTEKIRVTADPAKVRELSREGKSQRAIAGKLGVSKTAVARILAEQEKHSREPAAVR
ncbi:DUF2637 domain-containing protein [Arthrobacter sp. NPDC057013]|uniref:DUF2637 domain-containing protein n=1 Tax=Arthrobacter sp. NPDC057013 TaxID=3345999 RepID=UPI0036396C27